MFRLLLLLACLFASAYAFADSYVAGNGSFVPTLLTDDPFVTNEIATAVTRIRNPASDGSPAVDETEFGLEFAKRVALGRPLFGAFRRQ